MTLSSITFASAPKKAAIRIPSFSSSYYREQIQTWRRRESILLSTTSAWAPKEVATRIPSSTWRTSLKTP